MTATPEQIAAIGRAARALLGFAWSRNPRLDLLVINDLIAVTKTFSTDPVASAVLVRRALQPAHLREHGFKELRWIAQHIAVIAAADPDLAIDIYRAAYGYAEASDDSTDLSSSALLPLRSSRRQDYEGAWFQLSEAFPTVIEGNLEAGVRALARSLDGYVGRGRQSPHPGEPATSTFPLNGTIAFFKPDFSHSWYRGGYQPRQDAPVLLSKFDRQLRHIAHGDGAADKMRHILNVLAGEAGLAAIWASLLVAGTETPAVLAATLLPLACAAPIMMSSDTRYQLGGFLTAAYPHLSDDDRSSIETAILALAGERGERSKMILAGCIPRALVTTSEMRSFLEQSAKSGSSQPNIPPVRRYTSAVRSIDNDAYPEVEGVSIDEPESSALLQLMRQLDAHSTATGAEDFSLPSLRRQLRDLTALQDGLAERFAGKVPDTLVEHATVLLAAAAARLASAEPAVLKARAVRKALKRVLLFCASSANPHFDADRENNFHENIHWREPSARTSAADGLVLLVRADKKRVPAIMAAIRNLARDPVADVRLQIIQRLGWLQHLDPAWAWSEAEFVLAEEPTRGVVAGAICALAPLARLDVARAIRLAKELLRRYADGNEAGMAHCRSLAAIFIADIHIQRDNAGAAEFVSALVKQMLANEGLIRQLTERYSDKLLLGSIDQPDAADNEPRKKTLALYRNFVEGAFAEIERRAPSLDPRKFNSLPSGDQDAVRSMFRVLDEVSIRLFFASGAHSNDLIPPNAITPQSARLYSESSGIFARLGGAIVAPIAHHLIEALEAFIPLDPPGVFAIIAQAVRSAEQGGYALESMAADLVVRIVERYLADYRFVFADRARLNDLMDSLDIFVRAGWPAAQSLTFRLGEIWR